MRTVIIRETMRRTEPSLQAGNPDFRPRRFLLSYVDRFLRRLQPSEALLRLAISSLDMKSKAKVLELVRGYKRADLQDGPSEDDVANSISDVFALQRYLIHRVKGVAFDPWWRVFARTVIQFHRKELSEGKSPTTIKKDTSIGVEQMWYRLGLDRVEQSLIAFLCCMICYPWLESFLLDSSRWNYASLISVGIGSTPEAVSKAMSKQGRLVRLGLIEYQRDMNGKNETLGVSSAVAEFLSGVDWDTTIAQYYAVDSGEVYEISSFPVSARTSEVLQALLRSSTPTHVLLHGVPGTGKTQYARSLVRSVKKRALNVKHGQEGKLSERRLALQLATAFADQNTDVLIVDEADVILNTAYRLFGQQSEIDKGWVNDFIDSCSESIIWITNEVSFIEESLLRRFTYNVRFTLPARSKREEIWMREIKELKLAGKIARSTARSLSARYRLTPAAISSALRTVHRLIEDKALADGEIQRALEEILRTSQSLLKGPSTRGATEIDDLYIPEALHTDQNMESVIGLVSHGLKKDNMNVGVNILFWGLPGTGKTEFARYLAAKVGADLIDRKASELLNCFVGETEKNIRRAFEEAYQQQAILLLDEADSFLRERETAVHSWETTQVNELLTNMETHRGVLICSANLIDCFDRAAMRRFALKVQFKPLTNQGKLAVYRRFFPRCLASFSEQERSVLFRLPHLTLGDFKAVWTRLCFLREAPEESSIVLRALQEECMYRKEVGHEIGFHS